MNAGTPSIVLPSMYGSAMKGKECGLDASIYLFQILLRLVQSAVFLQFDKYHVSIRISYVFADVHMRFIQPTVPVLTSTSCFPLSGNVKRRLGVRGHILNCELMLCTLLPSCGSFFI